MVVSDPFCDPFCVPFCGLVVVIGEEEGSRDLAHDQLLNPLEGVPVEPLDALRQLRQLGHHLEPCFSLSKACFFVFLLFPSALTPNNFLGRQVL